MFNLKNRIVLVTGGNSGIGLSYAKGIVKAGGNVCLWGTNVEKNRDAVSILQAINSE
jgi:NAD(P)-dependent dehydrogenase (short-subunit alcohol dehydrogenase family)